MHENLTAVCISRQQEPWKLNTVPFLCYTEGWKPFQRERTRERVEYLAYRRNGAVMAALKAFPDTEYILMIDSYYLNQLDQVRILLREYDGKGILGGGIWVLDKTRLTPRVRFWDTWTTPELTNMKYISHMTGRVPVRAVGACYLYPRRIWEKVGYGIPEDLHGCEHNYLCERSGSEVYLSLGVRLWRRPVVYSWPKRLRQTLHLGRIRRRNASVWVP